MTEGYASRVERALLSIVFLVLWFLPLIIAGLYKLPHQGRIAVLSIALGWTGVAWLAALTITVGGAIRATDPPAPGSRPWPDSPARPQAQSPDIAASPEPSPAPEQPSFPPVRSPWPGRQQ